MDGEPRQTSETVLLLGASGFIGSTVAARLHAEGYSVRHVVRSGGARLLGGDTLVRIDLRSATHPNDWQDHLGGVTAVVNCAGVLQDNARDSTAAVHFEAPAALYQACSERGIRRVIHVSALGVERGGVTRFSDSKRRIEDFLQTDTNLDWAILRPSVVVGRPAYGGSALFRGLAALPMRPRVSDAGRISIVQLSDVAETISRLLKPGSPTRIAIELAGPDPLEFDRVVDAYRDWLGWRPTRRLPATPLLMKLAYKLGDLAGALGWRPPVRSTAAREVTRGAEGDPEEWTRLTGISPVALRQAFAREPASVQERWFARLYFLKPLAIVIFAAFWIMTGIVSLGPGYDIGVALMQEGGAGPLSSASVIAGGLADLAIGLALLWRPTTRIALYGAIGITVFYVAAGTAILPRLWEDPLGPMMKVWPILALNFLLLAILDER